MTCVWLYIICLLLSCLNVYPVLTAVHEFMDFPNCKETNGQTGDECINCIRYGEIKVNKYLCQDWVSYNRVNVDMACYRLEYHDIHKHVDKSRMPQSYAIPYI